MRFGRRFTIELFGSSHGPEVGVTVEGLPRGLPFDLMAIQAALDRRRPVGRKLSTRRREEDELVVDAGYAAGGSDGGPFRAHVRNTDVRGSDYDRIRETPRPGHADYPARVRYGASADLSGGGIFSGRMTVGLVIAGSIARQVLERRGVVVGSFTTRVGGIEASVPESTPVPELVRAAALNEVGCPDPRAARAMEEEIALARRAGDSLGGLIETRIDGLPVGLGEPFFDSVESVLAHLLFSIPAVKGVDFGAGFRAAMMRGSEHNDPFFFDGDRVRTRTNHAGGVLGGLATGMPVVFRTAVKPTSSIARPQETVDLARGRSATLKLTGRHDPCIVPRAVVVVESVAAVGLLDLGWSGGFFR